MTLLTNDTIKEMNSLSGMSNFFPFPVWWQEESKNEKIKEITKSFIEPLFYFLQNNGCNIVNKKEISDFLNDHVNIVDYLYEAIDAIRKEFDNAMFSLELIFDSEIEDSEGELFLSIETDFDVKDAHNRLNRVDEEWLLKKAGKDIGRFNLRLDFI